MKKSIIISLLAAATLWAQGDYGAPGTLKWRYEIGGYVSSSLAIGPDGTVYVGSYDDGYLYAISPTGNLKWREFGVIFSPAIGYDGTVYVGSIDSCLYAINPGGTLKWKYQTRGVVVSSPAIDFDGTIYVGSIDSCLYAINPGGTLKWKYQTRGAVESSPVIDFDGTIYVGSIDSYLYAINQDGTLKWRYETGNAVVFPPAIGSDGTVYVGSFDGYLYAISPDGSLQWRYNTGDQVRSCPAIGLDGTIYVGSAYDNLYAINSDGTLKWRHQTLEGTFSPPAVGSDGTIYFGTPDGNLYAINPDGSLQWRYETGDEVRYCPAIGSDGTIYVGSWDGYLYAIRSASKGLANSPWPKFGHDNQNTGRASGEAIAAKPSTPPAPPELAFKVETSDTDADGIFEGGESVSLTVSVTNSGEGVAEGVTVSLSGPDVLLGRIGSSKTITSIGPGETKSVRFSGLLPYDVESQNVEVRVTVSESQLGKIPQKKVLQVAIAPAPTEVEREVVSRIVDVDQVPPKRTTQENAYAVVIGIEEYREEGIPLVSYARSDAEKVREYLMNVVGIRADRIYTILDDDATTVDVAELIEDRLPMVVDEKSLVFIYYAGHGTHDDEGNSYLIPYNGKLTSTRSLYALSDLNAALSKLPTENVVVALDACFTGGGRSAMAEGARPAVMAKLPDFKHVTLAAAKASQAANAYDQAKHGLFTYYLLKGLKGDADADSDGWVELGELSRYISDNVSKTAARVLFKEQTPTVIPGDMGGKERMRIGKAK